MKFYKLATLFFLSFGILFVVSCEDELSIDRTQNLNDHKRIMVWKNGINHLRENHPKAKKEIKERFISTKSNNGWLYSPTYQISIDTMHTQFYELESTQGMIDVYTFRVSRQNQIPNVFENYLMRVNPDETIEQYLIAYPFTFTDNGIQYDNDNISVQAIEDDGLIINKCLPVIVGTTFYTVCNTPCTHIGPDGPTEHTDPSVCSCYGTANGSSCNPPTDCHNEVVNILGCSGLGGGGDGSSDTNDPTTTIGGGNNSGSDDTNNDNSTPVIANEPDVLLSQAVKDFKETLPQDQLDWLESLNCEDLALADANTTCNQNLYDDIISFLNSNTENGQVTAEAQAFFDAAVQVLQNNPDADFNELFLFFSDDQVVITNIEATNNEPEINNYSDIDTFFNSLANEDFENQSSEIIDQQNNVRRDIHVVPISNFLEASIVATINVKVPDLDNDGNPDSFEVLRVDTQFDGVSSLFSWEQLDNTDVSNPEGPVVTFNDFAQSAKIEIRGKLTVGFNYFGNLLQVTRVGTLFIYYHTDTGLLNENLSYWWPVNN